MGFEGGVNGEGTFTTSFFSGTIVFAGELSVDATGGGTALVGVRISAGARAVGVCGLANAAAAAAIVVAVGLRVLFRANNSLGIFF